ncbi:MAG: hypothetical protein MUP85_03350 [Candidatus Lokiarchaeota archaeon]|nr:hypothetical protein [Candidatus Lokiarchaeota archaeon]
MHSIEYNVYDRMEKIVKQIEIQDEEWAQDWKIIVSIFEKIDELEKLFSKLDVPYLREIQQKVLILNLEKYGWSLQNYIVEKYSQA